MWLRATDSEVVFGEQGDVALRRAGARVGDPVRPAAELAYVACDAANQQPMWRPAAEGGAREVLLAGAAVGQPEAVRQWALRALAAVGQPEAVRQQCTGEEEGLRQ